MDPKFRSIQKTSWWIESHAAFQRFTTNQFAQGYELLRRIERYREILKPHFSPDRTWKQLYQSERDSFALQYRRALAKLGMHKLIWAGPGGISFNASFSDDYLLRALKQECRASTPFALTGNYRVKSAFAVHPAGETAYVTRPADGPFWTRGHDGMVYLKFPRYERYEADRLLTDREAIAYFRTFIKDRPPKEFLEFRKKLPLLRNPPRPLAPGTIALGLLAHDYAELPGSELADLARWLEKNYRGKNILRVEQGRTLGALHNAKTSFLKLITRAQSLRF